MDPSGRAILDAAARVLAGKPDATMAEIAAAAGCSRATLYRRFATRHELLAALMDAAAADAVRRIDDAGLHSVPVEEGVRRAMRALLAAGDKYIVLTYARLPPDPAGMEVIAPALVELFRRGRKEGQFRSDVPLSWLIEGLVALSIAAARTRAACAFSSEDAAARVASVFLDGATTARLAIDAPRSDFGA